MRVIEYLFHAFSIAAAIAGLVMMMMWVRSPSAGLFIAASAMIAVAGIAQGLTKSIKRFRGRSAMLHAPADAGHCVLYLRSFAADEAMAKGRELILSMEALRSGEEQIADALSEIGALVALNKPGETLPPPGAVRVEADDSNWRTLVGKRLKDARLVLVRIGATQGLIWELRCAIDLVPPERLILLVPTDEPEYERFKLSMHGVFPQTLPGFRPSGLSIAGIGALITFGDHWKPIYKNLDRSFHRSFKPAFRNLGIPWRPRSIDERLMQTFSVLLAIALLACLAGAFIFLVGK